MAASRRHLAGFASALAITALMTLLLTSTVVGSTVVHRVSAGGPDACAALGVKPGCDGNYSFVALQYADGSASGQYTDRFSGGHGIIGVVDCVRVVGNQAWLSGVITSGRGFDGSDLTGLPFTTRVVDNGTSAQQPPDQISSSHTGDPTPCTDMVRWDLFDTPQGQVTIN